MNYFPSVSREPSEFWMDFKTFTQMLDSGSDLEEAGFFFVFVVFRFGLRRRNKRVKIRDVIKKCVFFIAWGFCGGEMNLSHASVHPVEDHPSTDNNNNVPRLRMKDIQGMPGTKGGLMLRLCQFIFAAAAVSVMATTSDFPSVTAFCYLVAAAGLQCLWSLLLAIVDIYALLVMRSLQNYRVVSFLAIGDGITSTLTFAAACASAGITVLIDNDLSSCTKNHCAQFETSTAMAFISWFTALPSFLLNFWSLASR